VRRDVRLWTGRAVLFGRDDVVAGVVPVGTPLVHIEADVDKTVPVRWPGTDLPGRLLLEAPEAASNDSSPQGYFAPSTPPSAAFSHSASVGIRKLLRWTPLSQWQ
jgi:hypothetical protein